MIWTTAVRSSVRPFNTLKGDIASKISRVVNHSRQRALRRTVFSRWVRLSTDTVTLQLLEHVRGTLTVGNWSATPKKLINSLRISRKLLQSKAANLGAFPSEITIRLEKKKTNQSPVYGKATSLAHPSQSLDAYIYLLESAEKEFATACRTPTLGSRPVRERYIYSF